MNKRQWKKQYKKTHGCNPKIVEHSFSFFVLKGIISKIKNVAYDFLQVLVKLINDIKSMSDAEFEEKLQLFTAEEREIVIKIRNSKRNKYTRE